MIKPGAKRAPAWFKGDAGAAESSIEAAKQLGFIVGKVE